MPPPFLTPYALYLAGAVGAVGLYLLMRPSPRAGTSQVRVIGTLIALVGLGLLGAEALKGVADLPSEAGPLGRIPVLSALFGLIAVAGAVRMITHPKPVFAALYFVLVVLASAGLFLLLHAEFMAFALIIVYAGAILITYMFVLMLAQQSPQDAPGPAAGDETLGGGSGPHDIEASTQYDRIPREPLAAIAVGFLLLATLSDAIIGAGAPSRQAPSAAEVEDAALAQWRGLDAMPKLLDSTLARVASAELALPDAEHALGSAPYRDGSYVRLRPDGQATAQVLVQILGDEEGGIAETREIVLPDSAMPTNTQLVGLSLVSRFPASLELASVILLMAMFGAVVLARKQIELGEDERREAAGMRRLTVDDPEPIGSGSAATGARGGGARS